jgi:hypothetical protein
MQLGPAEPLEPTTRPGRSRSHGGLVGTGTLAMTHSTYPPLYTAAKDLMLPLGVAKSSHRVFPHRRASRSGHAGWGHHHGRPS